MSSCSLGSRALLICVALLSSLELPLRFEFIRPRSDDYDDGLFSILIAMCIRAGAKEDGWSFMSVGFVPSQDLGKRLGILASKLGASIAYF